MRLVPNQDGKKSLNYSPNFTSIALQCRNRFGKTASRRARLRNPNRQHWLQSRKHGVYRNLWRTSHSSAFRSSIPIVALFEKELKSKPSSWDLVSTAMPFTHKRTLRDLQLPQRNRNHTVVLQIFCRDYQNKFNHIIRSPQGGFFF
jgi:hypothetical protein